MSRLNRIESHRESYKRLELACEATHFLTTKIKDVKEIILFGSTARGEASWRSDIDLGVIISGDKTKDPDLIFKRAEAERKLTSAKIGSGLRIFDVTCWWEDELEMARQLAKDQPEKYEENGVEATLRGVVLDGLTLYHSL